MFLVKRERKKEDAARLGWEINDYPSDIEKKKKGFK